MQNKIETMLRMQNELNNATAGDEWISGIAANGKYTTWDLYSLLETAEFIESFPYKHWKDVNAKADIENAKIELVDIYHFLMSDFISTHADIDDIDFEELSTGISDTLKALPLVRPDSRDHIDEAKKLMRLLLDVTPTLHLFKQFFIILYNLGMNVDELYTLYIGKNVLNKFRQEHGYKEGTYIKVWDNKEDNAHMQLILENDPDITPDTLYKNLEYAYKELTK